MKHYTWGQNLNQGKDSNEIDLLANKEDSLKIEGRDPFQKIYTIIPITNSIKIWDLYTTDPTEGKMTKRNMINRVHRTSQDRQPLLDALAVDAIDVMKMWRLVER